METLSVYPHFTAFFNRLAGGPENGPRYLLDSNLDWGQGLKDLKEYMRQQGLGHVCLEYFGTADPRYYGIEHSPIEDPEQEAKLRPGGERDLPVRLISEGYAIYVYDLRTERGRGAGEGRKTGPPVLCVTGVSPQTS